MIQSEIPLWQICLIIFIIPALIHKGGHNMNGLDIVILIYLIISAVAGLAQGLIRSVLSVVGLIVGIILASNFYQQLGDVLTFTHNDDVSNILAFVIILLAVMAVAALVAFILRTIIKAIMLGWIDRIGGAALGLLLGALSVSALLAVVTKYSGSALITDSALASFFLDKFPFILGLLPSSFDTVRDFFK
jgi:membrane protein required for colicin V production